MPTVPGAAAHVRVTIALVKQQLLRRDQEGEAETAARRLDADEVGRRAVARQAEREAARSDADPPAEP